MSKFLERVEHVTEQLHELVEHLNAAPETGTVYCHDIKETLSVLQHDLTCAVMDDGETSYERKADLQLPTIFKEKEACLQPPSTTS